MPRLPRGIEALTSAPSQGLTSHYDTQKAWRRHPATKLRTELETLPDPDSHVATSTRRVLAAAIGFFTLVLSGFAAHESIAQASPDEKKECVSQIRQRTAAFVAEDWQQLQRLAKRYIDTCKAIYGSEALSDAHGAIAFANLRFGNASASLSAAESCIALFYSNSGCHLAKVEAMLKLGRIPEAHAELQFAEKLVAHLSAMAERELQSASHPAERELQAAKLYLLRAQESQVERLRQRVSP